MSFVLIPLSRVDFDHIELAVLAIPVEDALHARPSAPFHAPPARPCAPHADLRHSRNVNVGPIDPRVTPPCVPCLLPFDARAATGNTARTVRRRLSCILLSYEPAAAARPTRPTLAPVPTAATVNFLSMVTRYGAFLLPPAELALRRR